MTPRPEDARTADPETGLPVDRAADQPSDPAPGLGMTGVRKSFGPVRALDDVSFAVQRGEIHALVGENGAGKSTLMKILSGALAPDAGEITLWGRRYAPGDALTARRSGVAMIYQELNLAPQLTVEENLLLGGEPARFGWRDRPAARRLAEQALATLEHPDLRPDRPVSELGPAERQLVEIARALVGEVRLLILDEPTSSLDREDAQRLFRIVKRLRDDGVTVIYISHFLEEVMEVADRFTVLRDGRTVGTRDVGSVSIEEIIELMAGRALGDFFPRSVRSPGDVVLELDGLAGARVPRAASLALRRGEILGVAGLVGAGRTELLRAIYGLDAVLAGAVRVAGVAAVQPTPGRSLARGVGLLSEDRKEEGLALSLPVTVNLTLSKLTPFTRRGWLSRGGQAAAARAWMERTGIRARDPWQPAGELSGGNQQKVALARLLHHDVDVLLLDEPTRGVDVASKVEIYRLMDALVASGKAVLMVSSYLPELLGVCDRIAVMHRGSLGAARAVEEWDESSLLDEATRGAA